MPRKLYAALDKHGKEIRQLWLQAATWDEADSAAAVALKCDRNGNYARWVEGDRVLRLLRDERGRLP